MSLIEEEIINPFAWERGKVVPTIPYDTIKEILLLPFPDNFDLYCNYMDLILKDWQREECMNMIQNPKYLINWGRGMSKTILFHLVAVFVALFDMRVIYLVPRVDELEQPMQYFNANAFVDCNSYKKTEKTFSIKKGMWYYVLGKPMIKISNIDDKGFNVSSGRFNFTLYDECALLMYYAKEVELFNKAAGMLRAMDYPHRIFASTPLIGSHFVTMLEDYKIHNPDLFSWRNFENTIENFLTDTPEKRRQMEEERQDAIRQGILWAWETENLALPRTAKGPAFKNYIEEPSTDFAVKHHSRIGFDFHGYNTGHIWVALGYHAPSRPNDIYVIAEGQEKYDEEANADESMMFLADPFFNCELYGEGEVTNMVNGPFLKAGSPWGMQRTRIDGREKYNLEANMLNFTWHIDRSKTPHFFKDFTEAEWQDQNKMELHKEHSGSKFRNHWIDAAMVALPKFVGDGVYIPNKRLRAKSFVQQDIEAHQLRY
jgi:hypothetical protein